MVENVELKQIDVPSCEAGAPQPTLIFDEHLLVFGYRLSSGDGFAQSGQCAVIRVDFCLISKFGYPNDEALGNHRYYRNGLRWYSAYQVTNSEWIAELTAANRAHPRHSDQLFASYRHFIFTFHDSTLEFVVDSDLAITVKDGDVFQNVLQEFQGL